MAIGTALALTGLGIAAAGSVASSAIGAHAAGSAADKQAKAATEAGNLAQSSAATAAGGVDDAAKSATNSVYQTAGTVDDLLAKIPDTVKKQLAPYLHLGESGASGLEDLLAKGGPLDQKFAFDPKNIENTPGYQFTFNQGMEAIKRAASAQGKSLGGGTLKSLALYGEDAAKTVYGQEFQRSLDTFNTNRQSTALRLSGLLDTTRMGQSSATDVANTDEAIGVAQAANRTNAARYGADVGLNAAKYRGDTGMDAARIAGGAKESAAAAQAAGTVGAANAWSSGLSGVANDVGSFLTFKDLLSSASNKNKGVYSPAWNLPVRTSRTATVPSYYEWAMGNTNPEGE